MNKEKFKQLLVDQCFLVGVALPFTLFGILVSGVIFASWLLRLITNCF